MKTKLLYLENFTLLTCEAEVIDVLGENDRYSIILNQTVFYPQGGGQPYDKGAIDSPSAKFFVEEVRYFNDAVKHIGRFKNGTLKKGDKIKCLVDEPRRTLNSRIHSAGHVIDMSVTELQLNWTPSKGYHFPEGPYIEYIGALEESEREKLKTDIENLCNKAIKEGEKVGVRFISKEEMRSICHFVPDNIPSDKPGRVIMFGNFGVPCGGTHVSNLAEIKNITIRKIKNEDGNIRVGYGIL